MEAISTKLELITVTELDATRLRSAVSLVSPSIQAGLDRRAQDSERHLGFVESINHWERESAVVIESLFDGGRHTIRWPAELRDDHHIQIGPGDAFDHMTLGQIRELGR